jgi:DMSO/TMAO reductase YedYZ molybdopterin-dependent catalytic subunit
MDEIPEIISPDTLREERVPPGQRETERFPVLHYGSTPRISVDKWSFRIFGLVGEEKTLDYAEFSALPKVRVEADIHCVTSWSRLYTHWEGVSTSALKNLVTIKPEAKFVMVHAERKFTANLPLEDFFADDALFALKYEGEPLSSDHGFPVRLVVPRLYFWKSAKWVNGVEFMDKDRPGFWESGGYNMHGDPWTEERYSRD